MDKPTLLEALKALPEGDARRTKTGRVRELLPQIEAAQAAGYSNEDIAKTLAAQGLEVSKKTLETMLYRIRRGRGLHNPQPAKAEATTALVEEVVSGNVETKKAVEEEDVSGLSEKAKRERRATEFIKETPKNSILGRLKKESN